MKKRVLSVILCAVLTMAMMGCSTKTEEPAQDDAAKEEAAEESPTDADAESAKEDGGDKVVIGFAQSRMNHPYRVAAVEEFEAAVEEKGLNWEVVVCDGNNDAAKQTSDVEDLITQGVDLIVMSPITADALTPVAKTIMDAGIPLVLLDRTINSEDYTTFVGGDNRMIGEIVADAIAADLGEEGGNIVEIQGTLGASATIDRHEGFVDRIAEKYPNLKVVQDNTGEYDRAKAMTVMEDFIQTGVEVDAIYCHNDAMAMGAMTALQAAGVEGVKIYGADGTVELMDEIKKETVSGTAFYPTGSTKAVEVIEKILNGEEVEKKYMVDVPLVTLENIDEYYDSGI